jgi:transposase-like protein
MAETASLRWREHDVNPNLIYAWRRGTNIGALP